MVEIFICVDVDRTVLRSMRFFKEYVVPVWYDIAFIHGEDPQIVAAEHTLIDRIVLETSRGEGRAYDYMHTYFEAFPGKRSLTIDAIGERILDSLRDENGLLQESRIETILAENTVKTLQKLRNPPLTTWGFYTTGGDDTQHLKLYVINRILSEVAGLDSAGGITASEHKAKDIASWRGSDGSFSIPKDVAGIPGVRANHVVLIDDKPKNFQGENLDNITTVLAQQLDATKPDALVRYPFKTVPELINNIDI